MKMKIYYKIWIPVFAGLLMMTSCLGDLDTIPLDESVTSSATVYDNPEAYKQVLAKCYAVLAVAGQEGPHGMPDIEGIDEGFSTYNRMLWYAQELTTDEAVIGWDDGTLFDYHYQTWTSTGEFIASMYSRIFYMVTVTNEFLRETTDAKLDERNVPDGLRADIQYYRAEARFLRALAYWHAIDMYGSVPFVTEDDAPGAFFPEQISRADLFDYIESELLDIENLLEDAGANEYGRADKAAAWTLLAKLYLNASVYTGEDKNTECITYCNKVITSGYTLHPEFNELFGADNHLAGGIIFPITSDGDRTRSWGTMTVLVHAAIGGDMNPADYGVEGAWGGIRTTKEAVSKFMDISELKSAKWSVKSIKSTNAYPLIYVPGDHQGWDPAIAPQLASVLSDDVYEGYVWFAASTPFKITPEPNWDADWGDTGADGTLDVGGDNIVSPAEDGYYRIVVDLNDLSYTLTKTDWGVIGDATPGGWDSDTDMTYDAATDSWSVVVDLTDASMKFRANDDWAINLGDTGADGVLEYDGDNLTVTAGSYLVTLYLGTPDYTYTIESFANDSRNMFFTEGQNLEIEDITKFADGYAFPKFTNLTSAGEPGKHLTYPDTDFPMFRLADVYLMFAEAVLRGGSGGTMNEAVGYVNDVRTRAYGNTNGNINAGDLDLDFILDERVRELMWEGHRRTDLIRFGQFSDGDYVWAWKGGVKEGKKVEGWRDLFPLPATDIGANPNLVQNEGY